SDRIQKTNNGRKWKEKKRNVDAAQVLLSSKQRDHEKFETKMKDGEFETVQPHQYKSFRITVQVEANRKGTTHCVELKTGFTHADQGADVSLISDSLANALSVVRKLLPQPMKFQTAEGGSTITRHFASIQIGVAGIWRKVDVLVLPKIKNDTYSLLLGLPWLYQVKARIDIPTFSLRIGDREIDGKRVDIATTKFRQGKNQSIRLAIDDEQIAKKIKAEIDANLREMKTLSVPKNSNTQLDDPFEESSDTDTTVESYSEKSSDDDENQTERLNPSKQACHQVEVQGQSTKANFPTNRRPVRRSLSNEPRELIETWFTSCQAKIGDLVPDEESRFQLKQLLYTYKDINATEISDLPATDLYVHKVKLKEGTKPHH
ncbi:hypothetical protein EPUL_006276, partial [Erysiphe pulchra]